MSAIDTSFLNRLQDHTLAKLLSEPLLKYVAVASMRHMVKLDVAARVAPHLAGRNGKVGAGIVIGLPVAEPIDDNIPGAQFDINLPIDFLAKDDLSLGLSNGAGVTAEQIVSIGWLLLAQFLNQAVGSGNWYVAGFDPLEENKKYPGVNGYRLVLRVRGANDQPAKCDAPICTFAGGNCTITVQKAGATIYYTTDGTFPGPYTPPAGYPANTSTQYAAPFAVASGTIILVAAFVPNSTTVIGSDVWTFTAP
jgi:Fn3 associated